MFVINSRSSHLEFFQPKQLKKILKKIFFTVSEKVLHLLAWCFQNSFHSKCLRTFLRLAIYVRQIYELNFCYKNSIENRFEIISHQLL